MSNDPNNPSWPPSEGQPPGGTPWQQPPGYGPPPGPGAPYGGGPGYTGPGGYGSPQPPPHKPDSYMVWAILTTLFCCLPFGIVSIINASKVDSMYSAGDYGGARIASDSAKKWATWAAIAGLIVTGGYILLAVVAASNSTT
ncbi:MAG: CD225/dispanin family protein [Actinobacteria bacterium]|nr:CD225/dispanin family protein [Actinomycetota bacterium]